MEGIGQLLNDVDAALRKDEPSRETLETLTHAFGDHELLFDVFHHLYQSGYHILKQGERYTEDEVLEAYNEGHSDGYDEGHSAGYAEGYDQGLQDAREEREEED